MHYLTDRAKVILDIRANRLEQIRSQLSEIMDDLRDMLVDDMENAEAAVKLGFGHYDDYVDTEEGKRGIVYPENASPDIDAAIMLLDECADFMDIELEKCNWRDLPLGDNHG